MAKKKSISSAEKYDAVGHDNNHHEASSSSSSSDDDDDSLVLEGVLVRNPDVSDSDDDDDDDISSEEEEEMEPTTKKTKVAATDNNYDKNMNHNSDNKSGKQKATQMQHKHQQPTSRKKEKKSPNEPEMVQVEFLFCDMHTRFFHGIKTLLHQFGGGGGGVHVSHSSQLADLIIENNMVGTVLSTDINHHHDNHHEKPVKKHKNQPDASNENATAATTTTTQEEEANVFGFASILNLTTNHSNPCIQSLKSLCLQHCPKQHESEMQTVLSGNTARPVGFFFHERMVNVPMEITEILHQQLILDMDYAVNNADDEKERKSLDFGAFVRLAPCHYTRESGGSGGGGTVGGIVYKYFDDEVFATNAEFVYNFEVPKLHGGDKKNDADDGGDKMGCSVIVLTKTGHRVAMKELKKMIHGG